MKQSCKKFYVTTPIYYVTAAPHLGSLYSTLLADVAARYHKLAGQQVFFLTGTDEHGQKIAQAAATALMEPKAFTDSFIHAYKSVWQKYNIAYDYFIRTTDQDHIKAVQIWLQRLLDQGDIYKGSYQGWYCTPCESFVTEKESIAVQADQPLVCPDCHRTTGKVFESCYFFKLSAYQDRLLEFYQQNPDFMTPKERMAEIINFVQSGLKDLSISRTTISWGIPFPADDAHVTYVWADALNNYITAVGYGNDARAADLAYWWPADLQIMGKDIVRFHAIYWPAFLMASNLAMPKKLLVHGWIKIADQKMSKSLGNAIDPVALADTYGVDEIRYYLTRKMAITQDSQFSIEDIEQSINAELANAFGNLLNRMAMLAVKNGVIHLSVPLAWSVSSQNLHTACQQVAKDVWQLVQDGMFHRAVHRIWDAINLVNAYFHEHEPWKAVKHDKNLFLEIMSATVHSLRMIGLLLWPVMPSKMEIMLNSLGYTIQPDKNYIDELIVESWSYNFAITQIAPLFIKRESIMQQEPEKIILTSPVEPEEISNFIGIEDFAKVDLRVGTIIDCQTVDGSDKLVRSQVDLGDLGIRQVLSGIRKAYSPQDLIGKQALFIVNLKPRKMMGFDSQGMMLLASDDSVGLSLMSPVKQMVAGSKIG